jgi:hypothetical protein
MSGLRGMEGFWRNMRNWRNWCIFVINRIEGIRGMEPAYFFPFNSLSVKLIASIPPSRSYFFAPFKSTKEYEEL